MRIAKVHIRGISILQQGRYHQTEKLNKESPDDYEFRTWQEKAHINQDGFVFIPPMAFKKCLTTAASMMSEKIPGKGSSTYTKHFLSGVICAKPIVLDVKREEIKKAAVFSPAQGAQNKKGGRVMKYFPTVEKPNWKGIVEFVILDDMITEEVFSRYMIEAGNLVGVGVFRPENGGYYGRFAVEKIEWETRGI